MKETNRDQFLTVRWSNALALGLGLAALIYAAIALSTFAFSDRASFIGLVILGAFR